MKYDAQDCLLVQKNKLTDTIYDFRLKNAGLAEISRPGQFAHLLVPGKTLRRPISICDVQDDIIRQKTVRHHQLHLAWIGIRVGLVPMESWAYG